MTLRKLCRKKKGKLIMCWKKKEGKKKIALENKRKEIQIVCWEEK